MEWKKYIIAYNNDNPQKLPTEIKAARYTANSHMVYFYDFDDEVLFSFEPSLIKSIWLT